MPQKNKRGSSRQQQRQNKNAPDTACRSNSRRKQQSGGDGEKTPNNKNNNYNATKWNHRQSHSPKGDESLSTLFSGSELRTLKTILNIPDVNQVPLVMAGVILNKLPFVQRLIWRGQCCNVNETGPNHTTALMWAIKKKYIDIVDFLLSHGADPTAKNDNGDNVLFLALENKRWDEKSFVNLWKRIQSIAFIDVDYKNRTGHYMIHTAVRREWCTFLKILLAERANVNAENANGMTPLMMASYCSSPDMIEHLLSARPNLLKEDVNKCTALCYAMAFAVTRNSPPPHPVIDRLLVALAAKGITFSDFLNSRLDLILREPVKYKSGNQVAGTKTCVVTYALRHTKEARRILMTARFFERAVRAAEMVKENRAEMLRLMGLLGDVLMENREKACDEVEEKLLVESFVKEGAAELCLTVLKMQDRSEEQNPSAVSGKNDVDALALRALNLLVEACTSRLCSAGRTWLIGTHAEVAPHCRHLLERKDKRSQKYAQLRELLDKLEADELMWQSSLTVILKPPSVESPSGPSDETMRHSTSDSVLMFLERSATTGCGAHSNVKLLESQRAAGAAADVGLPWQPIWQIQNSNAANNRPSSRSQRVDKTGKADNRARKADKNESSESGMRQCRNGSPGQDRGSDKESDEGCDMIYIYPYWKDTEDTSPAEENRSLIRRTPRRPDAAEGGRGEEDAAATGDTIHSLSELLEKILTTYREIWSTEYGMRDDGDLSDLEVEQIIENEYLEMVRTNFASIANRLRESPRHNSEHARKTVERLEALLVNHKVRGEAVIRRSRSRFVDVDKSSGDHAKFGLKKGEDKESKTTVTMKNAYHLIPSIMKICDDEEDRTVTTIKKKIHGINAKVTHTAPLLLAAIAENGYKSRQHDDLLLYAHESDGGRWSYVEKSMVFFSKGIDCRGPSATELSVRTTGVPLGDGSVGSRWCDFVKSLEMSNDFRWLLNGDIRISSSRVGATNRHVISTGGNFSAVVLGLDPQNRPLAVKRIQKSSRVSAVMKNLVGPLVSLRNPNLLPYFTCTFENHELILATPLCEYNMGEYIMLTKNTPNMFARYVDIVRQFLSGLRFLHDRDEAIVHGNLKPSNIFLDLNGMVRIAEFGIHQALYKLVQAPNSSIIWFSRETFNSFKEASGITCTCASDIQVAGMLAHFVITAGRHPYGQAMEEILGNLERGTPQMSKQNVELHDLITWMLLYEPNERPTVNQVLSHVFFWSVEKKWQFLLACAGLAPSGSDLEQLPLDELHAFIDTVAEKENIRGKWLSLAKLKYPKFDYSRCERDTLVGLLRFVRICTVRYHVGTTCHGGANGECELRAFVLNAFPAVPLSLYRILESSRWFKHCALKQFAVVAALETSVASFTLTGPSLSS